MMRKFLPADIVKYVNRNIIRCVGLFVFLELVAVVVSILSWNYFALKTPIEFHVGVVIWICLMPLIVSGFPWKLLDQSWSGTVIDVTIEEEKGSYHIGGGRGPLYTKNVIYLTVKTDRGKEKYIAVREFGIRSHIGFSVPNEGDVRYHLHEYSAGDRIFHFYGLKEYYVVRKNSDILDCVICGAKNKKEQETCFYCGHALIQNVNLPPSSYDIIKEKENKRRGESGTHGQEEGRGA